MVELDAIAAQLPALVLGGELARPDFTDPDDRGLLRHFRESPPWRHGTANDCSGSLLAWARAAERDERENRP